MNSPTDIALLLRIARIPTSRQFSASWMKQLCTTWAEFMQLCRQDLAQIESFGAW
jgi:hypothetical protein